MHYINRDKGKLYNQWLLFYKMDPFIKKNSHEYRLLFRTLL